MFEILTSPIAKTILSIIAITTIIYAIKSILIIVSKYKILEKKIEFYKEEADFYKEESKYYKSLMQKNITLQKQNKSIKKQNKKLKQKNQSLKDNIESLEANIKCLNNTVNKLSEKNKKIQYESAIKNQEIEFYDYIHREYYVDGIDIELDFGISSYNECEAEYLTATVVKDMLNAIENNISSDLKILLKKYGVSFYFRDIESIKLESDINTIAYYCADYKEIHVGLNNNIKALITAIHHELGHFIDNARSKNYSDFYSKNDPEVAKLFESDIWGLRNYAKTNKQEFIAVAFEQYLYDKNSLNHIPSTKALVEKYINSLKDECSDSFDNSAETIEYNDYDFDDYSEDDEYAFV